METFEECRGNPELASCAIGAINAMIKVDVEIPKVCAQMGIIPMPEVPVRVTYNNPKLEELSDAEIATIYDVAKSGPARATVN